MAPPKGWAPRKFGFLTHFFQSFFNGRRASISDAHNLVQRTSSTCNPASSKFNLNEPLGFCSGKKTGQIFRSVPNNKHLPALSQVVIHFDFQSRKAASGHFAPFSRSNPRRRRDFFSSPCEFFLRFSPFTPAPTQKKTSRQPTQPTQSLATLFSNVKTENETKRETETAV